MCFISVNDFILFDDVEKCFYLLMYLYYCFLLLNYDILLNNGVLLL